MVMMELQGFNLFNCHLLYIASTTEDMLNYNLYLGFVAMISFCTSLLGDIFHFQAVTTAKRKRENFFFFFFYYLLGY